MRAKRKNQLMPCVTRQRRVKIAGMSSLSCTPPGYLTVTEAAAVLRMSRQGVDWHIRARGIGTVTSRLGRLLAASDVSALQARTKRTPGRKPRKP